MRTTDPAPLPVTFHGVDATRGLSASNGTPADAFRVYSGTTTKKSGSNLRINSIPRPVNNSTSADLETEIIIGNDLGVLESFGAPANLPAANVDGRNSNAEQCSLRRNASIASAPSLI